MALEATEKLAAREGVDGLSTRKIAAEMGYTSGTLYQVFENLGDLILHTNARTLDKLRGAIEAASGRGKNPRDSVEKICAAYIGFAAANHHLWELVFEYRWPKGARRPPWYDERIKACFSAMHLKLGELAGPKAPLDLGVQTLWCAIHGICVLQYSGRLDTVGAASPQLLLKFAVDNFLNGFLDRKK
jgi:AcrR family transcriptional regulator